MTLDTLIILAGAFVAALPFLGFPSSWDTALLFLAGVAIIGLGIAVRRRGARLLEKKHETYTENAQYESQHDTR